MAHRLAGILCDDSSGKMSRLAFGEFLGKFGRKQYLDFWLACSNYEHSAHSKRRESLFKHATSIVQQFQLDATKQTTQPLHFQPDTVKALLQTLETITNDKSRLGTLRELHELFAAVQEDAWQEMQKWLPRFMESVERSELQSVEITPSTIQDQENSRAGIPLNTSDVQSNIRHSSANRTETTSKHRSASLPQSSIVEQISRMQTLGTLEIKQEECAHNYHIPGTGVNDVLTFDARETIPINAINTKQAGTKPSWLRAGFLRKGGKKLSKRDMIVQSSAIEAKWSGLQINEFGVPDFVTESIAFLSLPGRIDTEGIYRLAGNAEQIEQLIELVQSSHPKQVLAQNWDVHVVSGALKQYFRDQKEPILTFQLYDSFVQLGREDDSSTNPTEVLNALESILIQLPATNLAILLTLFTHLHDVSEYKGQNKMSPANLAIVFGPNLLRPQIETTETMLDFNYVNRVIEILISHVELLENSSIKNKISGFAASKLTSISEVENVPINGEIESRQRSATRTRAFSSSDIRVPQELSTIGPQETQTKAWGISKLFNRFGSNTETAEKREMDTSMLFDSVSACLAYLNKVGLETDGIYRLAGNTPSIDNMLTALKEGCSPWELLTVHPPPDVHDIASLLKLLLRNFPEPLLTWPLYRSFLDIAEISGAAGDEATEAQLNGLRGLIRMLPKHNSLALLELFSHLNEVAKRASVNRMNASNLSIVFGPNLLRPRVETAETMLEFNLVNRVIEIIIRNFRYILEPQLRESMALSKQKSVVPVQKEEIPAKREASSKAPPPVPTGIERAKIIAISKLKKGMEDAKMGEGGNVDAVSTLNTRNYIGRRADIAIHQAKQEHLH